MKKKIIIALVLLSVIVLVVLIRLNSQNVSNRIPDVSVYIPNGISNEYEDAKSEYLNEWHEIWVYNLSKSEIDELESDLSNGIWKPLSDGECNYANEVYFDGLKIDYGESDEMFYLLYDCRADKFTAFDKTDTLLYAKRQILFVYNKTLGDYYCVYVGM